MAKSIPIEKHFELIEEAIAALEDGDLPLEDSLARYEKGLRSVRQARLLLDRFAARLDELRAEDADLGEADVTADG
jgi:exodeoxyribonuclease VII small subunit